MSRRLIPLYVFDDAADFHLRHSQGTLVEFQNEAKDINKFNEQEIAFKAWVVACLGQGKDKSYWVFLVRPGEQAEWRFPKEGETCEILLLSKSGKTKRSKWWVAERIDNPAASMGLPEGEAHRLPAFKVNVPNDVPKHTLRPLQDDTGEYGYGPAHGSKGGLSEKRAIKINIHLTICAATKDAELGAVNKLFNNPKKNRTEKQQAAFQFLLNFKNPGFTVNLFNHFPHLRDPLNNPGGMPTKVVTMLKGFNDHQLTAYRDVLSNLPCGICIIPGGPGAGKTHWNLVLTAAIQSKNTFFYGPGNVSNRSAKVLYILDINKPLDDTCNKIVRLYKGLGLKKFAVRLYGWRNKRGKDGEIDFTSKFLFTARLNRYRRKTFNQTCLAPTLDELVWDFYEANKTTRYRELASCTSMALKRGRDAKAEEFKSLVNQLYRDVLDRVDFIATTPVPAATGFDGLFNPDIVIFDESPHAREASTMIAIAQFEPVAWIFSGDHRQTRPFVASDDVRDNPWVPQMLVSMMERADRAGVIRHSLLINHRAYGGLQQLGSNLFYNQKMISGHPEDGRFPPSVQHLQRYLERFLPPSQKCLEPRLVICSAKGGEVQAGTSWYNQFNIEWVMERVSELLPDAMFRKVGKTERGTILVIAPYKEAYMRYKKAIQKLPKSWQARLNVEGRLEARTIDTVQGGEADFVFLDLVRSQATEFTDDANRLCVALTRARQAEIILMHPGMRWVGRYQDLTRNLSRVFAHCQNMGQVVEITSRDPRPMAQIPNEQRTYNDYVARKPKRDAVSQTERENEADGFEVRNEVPDGGEDVPDNGNLSLDDRAEPESIFASQFAGMSAFMEEILAEKKAKQAAQSRLHGKTQAEGNTRGRPSVNFQVNDAPRENGIYSANQPRDRDNNRPPTTDDRSAMSAVPAINNPHGADELRADDAPLESGVILTIGDPPVMEARSGAEKAGLAKSRWTVPAKTTPVPQAQVEKPENTDQPLILLTPPGQHSSPLRGTAPAKTMTSPQAAAPARTVPQSMPCTQRQRPRPDVKPGQTMCSTRDAHFDRVVRPDSAQGVRLGQRMPPAQAMCPTTATHPAWATPSDTSSRPTQTSPIINEARHAQKNQEANSLPSGQSWW